MKSKYLITLVVLLAVAVGLWLWASPKTVIERVTTFGAEEQPASFSTSTVITVGKVVRDAFGTTTRSSCLSRTISTLDTDIRLTFSDFGGFSPSAATGTFQGASTTVNYPAKYYGCERWEVYGMAADTITVTEFR